MLHALRYIQIVLRKLEVPLVIAFGTGVSLTLVALYLSILPRVVRVDPSDQRNRELRPVGPMREDGGTQQQWLPEIIEIPSDSPPAKFSRPRRKTIHFMPGPAPSSE